MVQRQRQRHPPTAKDTALALPFCFETLAGRTSNLHQRASTHPSNPIFHVSLSLCPLRCRPASLESLASAARCHPLQIRARHAGHSLRQAVLSLGLPLLFFTASSWHCEETEQMSTKVLKNSWTFFSVASEASGCAGCSSILKPPSPLFPLTYFVKPHAAQPR